MYLKRANPDARVRLLCAIGADPFSDALVTALESERVDTSLLLRRADRHIGLYAIHNRPDGERSFIYWRSESAARLTQQSLDELPASLRAPDCVYLTGISLAVLEAETPGGIYALLRRFSEGGSRVVFDTNYRPALWPGDRVARTAFDLALEQSDLALPGVEDMQALYGISSPKEISACLARSGVAMMVLKDGPADVLYGPPNEPKKFAITPVQDVVDTTAAGDAFSGTLLGSLSKGLPMEEALERAASMSARVIRHRGAILPPGG